MALSGHRRVDGARSGRLLVRGAMRDPSTIVRTEAIAAARLGDGPPDCAPILELTRDREPYVVLTAIDSLGSGCADPRDGRDCVADVSSPHRITSGPPDHRWQTGAHALLALARLDTAAALALLPAMAGAERVEVQDLRGPCRRHRRNRALLLRLAGDVDRNVQEAAIAGLAATAGHEADSVYILALARADTRWCWPRRRRSSAPPTPAPSRPCSTRSSA